MGDTGSLTLGFSIAFLAVSFSMNDPNIKPFSEGAIVCAFTILMVPVLDVGRVMWGRFRSGKAIFQPDRTHIHHEFLELGFSHRVTLFYILLLAFFFCVFNIVTVQYISNNIVLALDVIWWVLFYYWFQRLKRIRKAKIQHQVYA